MNEPLEQMLIQAHLDGATGQLEVRDGPRRRVFYLRDGRLVQTGSNLRKELAEELAVHLPGASPETVYQYQAGIRLANALRGVSPEGAWHPQRLPDREVRLDLLEAVWLGLELGVPLEEVRHRLADLDGQRPRWIREGPVPSQELPVPWAIRNWLADLDGARALDEVLAFGPAEPEVLGRALHLARLLGFVRPAEEAPAARVAPVRKEAEEVDAPPPATEPPPAEPASVAPADPEPPATPPADPEPVPVPAPPDPRARAPEARLAQRARIQQIIAEGLARTEDDTPAVSEFVHRGVVADEPPPADVAVSVPAPPPAPEPAAAAPLSPEEALLRTEVTRVEEAPDDFAVLGLTWEASPEAFRAAYFRLAQLLHPDRLRVDDQALRERASTAFDRVRDAWDTLGDPGKRKAYVDRVVHGVKTEEELAMERVQEILAAEGVFRRGLADFRAGRVVRAHAAFEEAVRHVPENSEFRVYLGYTTWRLHRGRDEARSMEGSLAMEEALQKLDRCDEGWMLLGRLYRETNREADAVRALIRALKVNPENRQALRELERIRQVREEPGTKGFFQRIFRRRPKERPQREPRVEVPTFGEE